MSNPILKCILKDSDIVRVACTVKLKILQGRNEVVLYLLKKKNRYQTEANGFNIRTEALGT